MKLDLKCLISHCFYFHPPIPKSHSIVKSSQTPWTQIKAESKTKNLIKLRPSPKVGIIQQVTGEGLKTISTIGFFATLGGELL